MRKIITTYYEAFDGTGFKDENECIEYENRMETENVEVFDDIIFSTDGESLKSAKSRTEFRYLSASCKYLYFRSKKALDLCVKLFKHNNIVSTGLNCTQTLYKWEFRDDKSCWIPITETLKTELVKMLDLETEMTIFKN